MPAHSLRLTSKLLPVLLSWVLSSSLLATDAGDPFTLVPEMEEPAGILAQPQQEVQRSRGLTEAQRGLDQLEAHLTSLWSQIRRIDLTTLSRHHVEETRGFELPEAPGELTGRVIGRDEATDRWFLELRGPRLPARYEIVHRYLYVFARFDPATGELDRLTVTIRGWVLE